MEIKHNECQNYNSYIFRANNTYYDVIVPKSKGLISVKSNRFGTCNHRATFKYYKSLKELKSKSKAFSYLVILIDENTIFYHA